MQTKRGPEAEPRRLVVELAQTGTLAKVDTTETEPEKMAHTFEDAVHDFARRISRTG